MGHTPFGTNHYRSSPRRQSPRGRSPRRPSPRGRSPRRNYSNRRSSRRENDRFYRPQYRSNSPRRSPSRSPAARRPWHNNGRNFTAPNESYHQYRTESYHQYSTSRYGHHQHAEGTSPGTLGEITNQSPLPSPRFRPGPSSRLRKMMRIPFSSAMVRVLSISRTTPSPTPNRFRAHC